MKTPINYSQQYIDSSDKKAVLKVLESESLTQGKNILLFEKLFSKKVKSKYAVTVSNATAGLYISCLALGIKNNDIVWTSSNSFVASSNAPLLCGAKIEFVDIDINTYNMSIQKLEEKLEMAKLTNTLPSLVIPVHFAGLMTYHKEIKKLSKKYNFKILEDASHSLGASDNDILSGSCKYSEISVFSFHPVKMITTGEGGMITTNSKKMYEQMLVLRSHGINKNKKLFQNKIFFNWSYEQISLSLNFRLTDIQSALGISQLKKLNMFVKKRNKIASIYNRKLVNFNIILPTVPKGFKSSFHLYVIRFKNHSIQSKVYNYMRKHNINVQVHYIPIHTQPYYKKFSKLLKNNLNNTNLYSKTCLSLPVFFTLNESQINFICNTLKNALIKYDK